MTIGANDGVTFIKEDDGSITAYDTKTGVASFGTTKAEALSMLAEALTFHEDESEPIPNPDAFLEEMGIDANRDITTPPWKIIE